MESQTLNSTYWQSLARAVEALAQARREEGGYVPKDDPVLQAIDIPANHPKLREGLLTWLSSEEIDTMTDIDQPKWVEFVEKLAKRSGATPHPRKVISSEPHVEEDDSEEDNFGDKICRILLLAGVPASVTIDLYNAIGNSELDADNLIKLGNYIQRAAGAVRKSVSGRVNFVEPSRAISVLEETNVTKTVDDIVSSLEVKARGAILVGGHALLSALYAAGKARYVSPGVYAVGKVEVRVDGYNCVRDAKVGKDLATYLTEVTNLRYEYSHTRPENLHMAALIGRFVKVVAEKGVYRFVDVHSKISPSAVYKFLGYKGTKSGLAYEAITTRLVGILHRLKSYVYVDRCYAARGCTMLNILVEIAKCQDVVTPEDYLHTKDLMDVMAAPLVSCVADGDNVLQELAVAYGGDVLDQIVFGDAARMVSTAKKLKAVYELATPTLDGSTIMYNSMARVGQVLPKFKKFVEANPMRSTSGGSAYTTATVTALTPAMMSKVLETNRAKVRIAEVDKTADGSNMTHFESGCVDEHAPFTFLNGVNVQESVLNALASLEKIAGGKVFTPVVGRDDAPCLVDIWDVNEDGNTLSALATYAEAPLNAVYSNVAYYSTSRDEQRSAAPMRTRFHLLPRHVTVNSGQGKVAIFARHIDQMPIGHGYEKDKIQETIAKELALADYDDIAMLCRMGPEWEYLMTPSGKIAMPAPLAPLLQKYPRVTFQAASRLHNGYFWVLASKVGGSYNVGNTTDFASMLNWRVFSLAFLAGMYVFNAIKNLCTATVHFGMRPIPAWGTFFSLGVGRYRYESRHTDLAYWQFSVKANAAVSHMLRADVQDIDDTTDFGAFLDSMTQVAEHAVDHGKEPDDEELELLDVSKGKQLPPPKPKPKTITLARTVVRVGATSPNIATPSRTLDEKAPLLKKKSARDELD